MRGIARDDFALLSPNLHSVELNTRQDFEKPGVPIEEICFPTAGIISVVALSSSGRSIEAGLIGFEGMTGLSVVLGGDRSPNHSYVQMPGRGQVIGADHLRDAMEASEPLRACFLKYAHVFLVQTAQTALANGRAKIDERLARWLLMAADRSEGPELPLTHEFLSTMLGVRRPGVTDALHRLEGDHLVRARRATIVIRDRAGLERVANGSYGVSEAEYDRVFDGLEPGADQPERTAA